MINVMALLFAAWNNCQVGLLLSPDPVGNVEWILDLIVHSSSWTLELNVDYLTTNMSKTTIVFISAFNLCP